MRTKFEKISLVVIGAVLGVSLSLNYPAVAEKIGVSMNPAMAMTNALLIWEKGKEGQLEVYPTTRADMSERILRG